MKVSSFRGCEKNSLISRHKLVPFLPRLNSPSSTRQLLCQNSRHTYRVEVEIDEQEDPEGAFKRFRNAVINASVIYEARKRRFFENPQDIKKRKQQEKGLRKQRDKREAYLLTLADRLEEEQEPHVFGDLFPVYSAEELASTALEAPVIPNTASASPGLNPEDYRKIERLNKIHNNLREEKWGRRFVESDGPSEAAGISGKSPAGEEPRKRPMPFETSKTRRANEKAARDLQGGQSTASRNRHTRHTTLPRPSPSKVEDLSRGSTPTPAQSSVPPSLAKTKAELGQDNVADARDVLQAVLPAEAIGAGAASRKSQKQLLQRSQMAHDLLAEQPKELSEEDRTLLWEEAAALSKNQTALQNQPRSGMTSSQKVNLKNKVSKTKKTIQAIAALLDVQPLATSKTSTDGPASSGHEDGSRTALTQRLSSLEAQDRSHMSPTQRANHRNRIRKTKDKIEEIDVASSISRKRAGGNSWEASGNREQDGAQMSANAIEGARAKFNSQFPDAEKPSKRTAGV